MSWRSLRARRQTPVRRLQGMGSAMTESAQGKVVAILAGFVGTSLGVLIGWFGSLSDIARLQENVNSIRNEIQELRVDIEATRNDRYRGEDAIRDQRYLTSRMDQNATQIQQNAKHIDELQKIIEEHIRRHP